MLKELKRWLNVGHTEKSLQSLRSVQESHVRLDKSFAELKLENLTNDSG